MKKLKIIIPISIVFIIMIVVIVTNINKNKEDSFKNYHSNDNSYVNQNIADSNNRAEQYEKTGLDLSEVGSINSATLKEYGLSLTGLSEQDFYFNGTSWDAVLLSDTNVPYRVTIYKDYTILIELDGPDGEESEI